MADSTLNRFVASGTTAERTAFTPTPPTPASGPDPGYLWWDTDLQAEYAWDAGSASWKATSAGGTGTVTNTGTLTSGKTIIGNGSADVTVSSLTAQFVGSSSGTAAAASMTTARILGRTTAGSGAVEEISVGTGLTLSAGSLTASGSSGSFVLLEQHTASSSASLDFTTFISSTYDTYQFHLINILPASSAVNLLMRVGTGAGPSWDSGSNYKWARWATNQSNGTAASGGVTDTSVEFMSSLANTSTAGYGGNLQLYDPQTTSSHKMLTFQGVALQSSGNMSQVTGGIQYLSTTALTGVQFLFSSGNIASGTIRVYGLAK